VLGSTLALAMGLVFLVTARLSGDPTAYGFVVFVGYLFVAVACALHLGAVLDRLIGSEAVLRRVSAKVVVWLLVGGGTAWLIGRTPSEEVLVALLLAPPTVGIAGLLVARDNRAPAVAFLAVAGLLMALVISVWLARQGG
jgi:Na+/phosphate symporter